MLLRLQQKDLIVRLSRPLLLISALTLLAGCAKHHELNETGGVVIKRSSCPAVAIPNGTGDITLFNPVNSTDSRALDLSATITNLRTTCQDTGSGDIVSTTIFDVQARRSDSHGARDVVLPYYSVVMQGGKFVISKRISQIGLHFNDGEARATTNGVAGGNIDRAAATLPNDLINRVNRKRKSGEDDAAVDPLSDPDTRAKISQASFEVLIGFQLTDEQLRYNVTR